jgi:hypothetical protein
MKQAARWRRHILPKRQLTLNGQHYIISYMIEIFDVIFSFKFYSSEDVYLLDTTPLKVN